MQIGADHEYATRGQGAGDLRTIANRSELKGRASACRSIFGKSLLKASTIRIA
jgi:hypothetical protein